MIERLPDDVIGVIIEYLENTEIYSLEKVLDKKFNDYEYFWKNKCKLNKSCNCKLSYYQIVKRLFEKKNCFACGEYLGWGYILLLNFDNTNDDYVLENYHKHCISQHFKTISLVTTYRSPITDTLVMGFHTNGV